MKKKVFCGGVVVVMVSAYFLPPEKKIISRKFSILCPTRFKTVREKMLKTAREEKIGSRKKQENSTREKNSLPENKNPNFASQKPKKKTLILKFLPKEKKCNPRKSLKICPRKIKNPKKNLGKGGQEKYFQPEKKTKEKPTIGFSVTLHFLGQENKEW